MAAAKTTRQNLEKALAEREASMDGWTISGRFDHLKVKVGLTFRRSWQQS
jgi:hypothetical protein